MAKFCTECGAPLEEGKKFCSECGNPIPSAAPEIPKQEEETELQPEQPVMPEAEEVIEVDFPVSETVSSFTEDSGIICHNCGAYITGDTKFCTECGASLGEAAEEISLAFSLPEEEVKEEVPPAAPPAPPVIEPPIKPQQSAKPVEKAFCQNCGTELDPEMMFCTECGTPRGEKPAEAAKPVAAPTVKPAAAPKEPVKETPKAEPKPAPKAEPKQAPKPKAVKEKPVKTVVVDEDAPESGSKYESISTGGWIGILLLLCVPVVGFIVAIVWACGGCKKIAKRNFSRAFVIITAIMMVISLIFGIIGGVAVGGVVKAIEKESGVTLDVKDLFGKQDDTQSNDKQNDGDGGGLLDLFGLLAGDDSSDSGTNSDIDALKDLSDLLGDLGSDDQTSNTISDLIDINEDAEKANDGWPDSLRAYPGGTATAISTYRTEISGTTQEEMLAWIEDLKVDGFAYQDFYDFGMTEDDMLSIPGWWATDGKIYLSLSLTGSTLTIDHTTELPDYSNLFGE